MTLTTHINFKEDIDLEKVFALARETIGIPTEQPFEIIQPFSGMFPTPHVQIRSKPGGFNAMLWVEYCESGQGDFDEESHEKYCDKYEDEPCHCRKWTVQVMLDTTYGFEPCCTCEHYQIIRKLVPKLNVPFEWEDEFTGNWYNCLPPEYCKYHGGELESLLMKL